MATNPWAPHFDIVFEIHDPWEWYPFELDSRRLNEMGVPIMLQKEIPEITRGQRYPLEDVISIGRDYFGSSLAYMMGLAILQNRPKIACMGYDMGGQDGYAHQRCNAEYWIGVAEGKGIEVEILDGSRLMKLWDSGTDEPGEQSAKRLYGLNGRYGYLKEAKNGSDSSNRRGERHG
jgi:hypothetical protein